MRDLQRAVARVRPVAGELATALGLDQLLAIAVGTKKARLDVFLRALGETKATLGREERERLDELLQDDAGQQLLTDYAEAVVRTSSRIANYALGLLYGSPSESAYSASFRRNACESLVGISDDLIVTYLDLLLYATGRLSGSNTAQGVHQVAGGAVDRMGPFVIVLLEGNQTADSLGRSLESLIVAQRYLIGRGLLLPDWAASGRYGGSPAVAFGIGDETRQYEHLLRRARQLSNPPG